VLQLSPCDVIPWRKLYESISKLNPAFWINTVLNKRGF
jgi:hypothetical protein